MIDHTAATTSWHRWRLDHDNDALVHLDTGHTVRLTSIENAATAARAIFAVHLHDWSEPADVAGLVQALDDVLDPTGIIFERLVTTSQIRRLVDRAVRQGAPTVENAGR